MSAGMLLHSAWRETQAENGIVSLLVCRRTLARPLHQEFRALGIFTQPRPRVQAWAAARTLLKIAIAHISCLLACRGQWQACCSIGCCGRPHGAAGN